MNKALLEYEMKRAGKTAAEMCELLGISKSAWYRKVNELSQFTRAEIEKIVEILNLDSPVDIFFAKKVS